MNTFIAIAAIGEAIIGLILIVDPQILVQLLFSTELNGVTIVMSRIAGISLISLGIACFPARIADNNILRILSAMLTYNLLMTLYLSYLFVLGTGVGSLLLPVVLVHACLTLVFALTIYTR